VRHRGQQAVSGRAGAQLGEQRSLPILPPLERRQVFSGAAGAFVPLGCACDDERCWPQQRRRHGDGVPDGDEVVKVIGVQCSVKQLESSEQLVGNGGDVSGGGDTVDRAHEGRAGRVVVAHDATGRQCSRRVGPGLAF